MSAGQKEGQKGVGGKLDPAAYRELKPGETYEPYVPAGATVPEFTARSVTLGIIMVLVFSVASTYSGLKIAQVMEAAIPISILAVGISGMFRRKNTILENVIVQSIGGASGLIVAGSIFTLPALYIMNVAPGTMSMLLTIFIVSVLGAALGLFFLIPLRHYFVAEQHGKLPFPEATAINEVYVTGEKGGEQAKTLVVAALVGGIYDFIAVTVRGWNEIVNFQFIPVVKKLATDFKATISINAISMIVGLGYITGLRFSAIICAGGFFSTLIVVPLVYHFGQHISAFAVPPAPLPGFASFIPDMNASQLFRLYAQRIGVGAMAGAGIIGILKAVPTIVRAFSLGFKQIFSRHADTQAVPRTDRDLKMSTVLGGIVVAAMAIGLFFYVLLSQGDPAVAGKAPQIALTGLAIAFVFAFLFTTVAALATAMTGNNPISGMTLVTLILGSSALVAVGLQGEFGKYAAIVMGAVVCTSLSMAGGFVTDLKVGYWLGSTPRHQEISKVIGTLFAAVGVALTVLLIHYAYGHTDAATGKFVTGFLDPAGAGAAGQPVRHDPLGHLRPGAGHLAALQRGAGALAPAAHDGDPAAGLRHRDVPAAPDQHAAVCRRLDLALGRQVQQGRQGLRGAQQPRHAARERVHRGRGAGGRAGGGAEPHQDGDPGPGLEGRLQVDRPTDRPAVAHGLQRGRQLAPDHLDGVLHRAVLVPVPRREEGESVAQGSGIRDQGRGDSDRPEASRLLAWALGLTTRSVGAPCTKPTRA